MPIKDRTNIRYGKLVAKQYVGDCKWLCQCDCGKEIIVHGNKLSKGQKSCGCLRGPRKDLRGQKFGRLTPLEYITGSKWKCQCDCGNIKEINGSSLINGYTKSCGCSFYSHGEENINKILTDNKIPYLYNIGYFPDLISDKGRPLRFDFILYPHTNQICLIEFDGPQHKEFKSSWNQTEEEWEQQIKRDKEKNEYCLKNNIPLYRIPYEYRDKLTLELLTDEKFLVKKEL